MRSRMGKMYQSGDKVKMKGTNQLMVVRWQDTDKPIVHCKYDGNAPIYIAISIEGVEYWQEAGKK